MMRLTDLLGCKVTTSDGRKLGHVYDVRVAPRGRSATRSIGRWRVEGLVVGTRGALERLGIRTSPGREPIRSDDVIPWEAVKHVRKDEIRVDQDRVPD